MNKTYDTECTRSAHFLWAMKQIALFVIPCAVLASAGVLLAKHLAPSYITIPDPKNN
jgi:hypothetical protein